MKSRQPTRKPKRNYSTWRKCWIIWILRNWKVKTPKDGSMFAKNWMPWRKNWPPNKPPAWRPRLIPSKRSWQIYTPRKWLRRRNPNSNLYGKIWKPCVMHYNVRMPGRLNWNVNWRTWRSSVKRKRRTDWINSSIVTLHHVRSTIRFRPPMVRFILRTMNQHPRTVLRPRWNQVRPIWPRMSKVVMSPPLVIPIFPVTPKPPSRRLHLRVW